MRGTSVRASSHLHSGGSVMVCISVGGVGDLVRQPKKSFGMCFKKPRQLFPKTN